MTIMKVFSGKSNEPLAIAIAQHLGLSVSPLEIFVFPDKEKRIRVLEPVIEDHCIVVQSCTTPVDENYMELFFIIDALKRSGAASVTVVLPYVGYQRQDHTFREGEAVSLEVISKTLEAVGMDGILAFDLHSIRIEQIFHVPLIHLSALPLFAKHIKEEGWADGHSILISPDMGGIRRIKILSELLGDMPYAMIEKNRDLSTGKVTADKIEGASLENSYGMKRALIVDDMISSGGTIVTATTLLRARGVEEIAVFATHPVFSEAAPKLLEETPVEKVFVTDTIDLPKEKRFPKLTVLSIAALIAQKLQEAS